MYNHRSSIFCSCFSWKAIWFSRTFSCHKSLAVYLKPRFFLYRNLSLILSTFEVILAPFLLVFGNLALFFGFLSFALLQTMILLNPCAAIMVILCNLKFLCCIVGGVAAILTLDVLENPMFLVILVIAEVSSFLIGVLTSFMACMLVHVLGFPSYDDQNHHQVNPTAENPPTQKKVRFENAINPELVQLTGENEKGCLVCTENKPDCCLIPCGHVFLCAKCCCQYNQGKCAVCRGEISSVIRIYMD